VGFNRRIWLASAQLACNRSSAEYVDARSASRRSALGERIVSSRDAVFYGDRAAVRAPLALRSYVR